MRRLGDPVKRFTQYFFQGEQELARETVLIDALRGIASLLVLVSHADAYYLIRYDPLGPYKGYLGETGVYLFFILSGFLIWTSALRQLPRQGGLYAYAIHRATRIMPLYYVALAFAIFAFPVLSHYTPETSGRGLGYDVMRHVTFTQALNPSVSRAFNPVLWTLSHEAVFYTLVPLLFLVRRVFPAIVGLAIFATWWGGHHEAATFAPFFRLCLLFAAGMTLAQYRLAPTRTFAELATLAAVLMGIAGLASDLVSAMWAIALVSIGVSMRNFSNARVIRALAFVGMVSYSLYVWHYMLIEIVGPHLIAWNTFPVRHPVATAIGFTGLCIAVSWISYRLFEHPGQTWLRNLLLPKRPVTVGDHGAP
jgi:peptidoglycan/LPS O-acetylase OafA/YrhL